MSNMVEKIFLGDKEHIGNASVYTTEAADARFFNVTGVTFVTKSGDTMIGELTLFSGSTTIAPLNFQVGELKGEGSVGDIEFDGDFYINNDTPYYESIYLPANSSTYAVTTSNGAGSAAYYPFDRTISLTGSMIVTTWFSSYLTFSYMKVSFLQTSSIRSISNGIRAPRGIST